MKPIEINAERYYTLTDVANHLNITPNTLKRWYAWYENNSFSKPYGIYLPPYKKLGNGVKIFKSEDMKDLKKFRYQVRTKYRGCMADFNKYWVLGKKNYLKELGEDYDKKRLSKTDE